MYDKLLRGNKFASAILSSRSEGELCVYTVIVGTGWELEMIMCGVSSKLACGVGYPWSIGNKSF